MVILFKVMHTLISCIVSILIVVSFTTNHTLLPQPLVGGGEYHKKHFGVKVGMLLVSVIKRIGGRFPF